MNGLSLDKILSELKGAEPSAKTAEAKPAESSKVAQTKAELVSAVKRAEAASTKTASAAPEAAKGPVAELTKVATDLAAADQEALVKEAQFYGAAICDGFMARLQQFEKAAESLPATKTAGAADVEKIAEEAVRGYIETQSAIKTAAEAEYKRGFDETMEYATKVASDLFAVGMHDCGKVLEAVR